MSLPATDSFTGTNGTQLTTYSANWTLNSGDFDIQTNALSPDDSGTELGAHWDADSFSANHYAQATLAAKADVSAAAGIAVRCNTSGDDYFYGVYADYNSMFLFELSNGSWAELDSIGSPSAGSVLKLTAIGTTGANLKGYEDSSEVLSASDGSLTTGAAGVSGYGDSASFRIDNWEGGDITSGTNLTVADGYCVSQADNVVTTKSSTLAVADGYSVSQADAVVLTKSDTLAVADGASTTQADNVVLVTGSDLTVADGASTTQADAIVLTKSDTLAVADGASVSQADAVVLTKSDTLAVADGASTTQADAVVLVQNINLTVADGASTTQADNVVLVQAVNLAVADGASTTQADAVVLTKSDTLTVADGASVSQADNIILTKSDTLAVADGFSTTQADALVISKSDNLAVADGYSTSQADAVVVDEIIPWTRLHSLIVNTGSIVSGSVRSTYGDDGTELVLAEVTGAPGFSYDFEFGEDQDVPYTAIKIIMKAWYDGNVGHTVKLQQYNYTGASWTDVSGATFPDETSEQTYNINLIDDANYLSSGEIKLRLLHVTAGAPTHQFHIDALYLADATPTLVVADSYSVSQADNVVLTKSDTLIVPDGYCVTYADPVTLTQNIHSRPASDTYVGTWTTDTGGDTNLYQAVDESVTPNDTDYIQSDVSPSSSPVVIALGSVSDPYSASSHYLRYRYAIDGAGTINLVVQLRQGYTNEGAPGTLIAEWTHNGIGTMTTAEQTLSEAEANSITDYTALFVRMVADQV